MSLSAQGTFKELDVVRIPESIAAAHRVRPTGTIVWHVPDAPYATVECARLDDNEDGLETELIDVDVSHLEKLALTQDNSAPLSEEELAEIARRCNAATRGPWRSYVEGREAMSGSSFIMTKGEDIYLSGATGADQDFIAAARSDVPKLLAEILRLKKQVAT